MEVKDNCAICLVSMARKPLVRLLPCMHLLHVKCYEPMQNNIEFSCPLCRERIVETIIFERKAYNKNNEKDRARIVNCANKGDDWVSLAETLNVKYKTAYHWVRSGRDKMLKKGGKKPKTLSNEIVENMISWVEEDCCITLKQLQSKLIREHNINISTSSVANYLENQLFRLKSVHHISVTMNSTENKQRRSDYVTSLNNCIQQGKQIIWIDETNFNLFCRRNQGRARIGDRAIQILPASKGPNVHLIGAMSAAGIVNFKRRRGSYTSQLANEWIIELIEHWRMLGNDVNDLIIVCDNAPCHAQLEIAINGTGANLLRLGPYSPMLNPMETIWSKIKTEVKNRLRIPLVIAPGVMEQRLIYLEEHIDYAKNTIVGGDCARAVQHTTTFHGAALALDNMDAGA